jgi:hypothetical protein
MPYGTSRIATSSPSAVSVVCSRSSNPATESSFREDRCGPCGEQQREREGNACRGAAHWNQVQGDWDRHIKQIRARITAKKAEHNADVAERDAEWAEADAYDAVEFAQAAIEEAEYAVLDAVLARKDADVLAAAT